MSTDERTIDKDDVLTFECCGNDNKTRHPLLKRPGVQIQRRPSPLQNETEPCFVEDAECVEEERLNAGIGFFRPTYPFSLCYIIRYGKDGTTSESFYMRSDDDGEYDEIDAMDAIKFAIIEEVSRNPEFVRQVLLSEHFFAVDDDLVSKTIAAGYDRVAVVDTMDAHENSTTGTMRACYLVHNTEVDVKRVIENATTIKSLCGVFGSETS